MSVPELPYSVSEHPLDCYRNTTKSIDELCLDLNKLHERLCLNLEEINQRNIKIADNLHELHLGLIMPNSKKTVASYDLDPDPSSGIDSGEVISQGFCGPSNHQWDQTMLQNFKLQMQTQAVPVSDFSYLTKPTSRKNVASSDLGPDPSYGLNYGGVIA